METVPFSSQNMALSLALSSLKGEELPRKNDSYGSQRIYYTSGFHSFLPFKKRQTYCKGAQQACTVMLSFPLKQHVLCCKYSPLIVLITPSCWLDSVPFPIKGCNIVEQGSEGLILTLTALFIRTCRLRCLSLPFYLSGEDDSHVQLHGFVYQCVLGFISDATTLFMKSGRFPC